MLTLGCGLGVAKRLGGALPFHPSDLSPDMILDTGEALTMFQDVNGLTQSSATGNPVRLMLDVSQDLAEGANMYTGAWYTYGDCSYGGNSASQDALDPANRSKRVTGMTVGQWYRFRADISTTATGATIHFNSSYFFSGTSYYTRAIPSGSTSVDMYFKAQSTSMYVGAEAANEELSGWTITVANGNFTSIAGNHVTAPSDAARPTIQADGSLADDGADSLIAPLSGTFSAYIATTGGMIEAENVTMANDYDLLRNNMVGAVVTSSPLSAGDKGKIASYFGV